MYLFHDLNNLSPLDRKVRRFLNLFYIVVKIKEYFFVNLFLLKQFVTTLFFISFKYCFPFDFVEENKCESTIFHVRNCFRVHFNGC